MNMEIGDRFLHKKEGNVYALTAFSRVLFSNIVVCVLDRPKACGILPVVCVSSLFEKCSKEILL